MLKELHRSRPLAALRRAVEQRHGTLSGVEILHVPCLTFGTLSDFMFRDYSAGKREKSVVSWKENGRVFLE